LRELRNSDYSEVGLPCILPSTASMAILVIRCMTDLEALSLHMFSALNVKRELISDRDKLVTFRRRIFPSFALASDRWTKYKLPAQVV